MSNKPQAIKDFKLHLQLTLEYVTPVGLLSDVCKPFFKKTISTIQFALDCDEHIPAASKFSVRKIKPTILSQILYIQLNQEFLDSQQYFLTDERKNGSNKKVLRKIIREIYIYILNFYTSEKWMGKFILHFSITIALQMKGHAGSEMTSKKA